jgi:hypothetical protein
VLITRSAQHACPFGHDEAERARPHGNDAIDWGADYRAKDDDAIDCDANRRRTINSVTIDDGEPSRYDSSYDGGGSTSSSSDDRRRDRPTNNCRDGSAHNGSGSTSSSPDHRGRDSPPHDSRSSGSPPDHRGRHRPTHHSRSPGSPPHDGCRDRPPRRLDGDAGCVNRKASRRYGDPRSGDGAPRRSRNQDRPSHDGRRDRPPHNGRSASGTPDDGSTLDYGTRWNGTPHDGRDDSSHNHGSSGDRPSHDGRPSSRTPHHDGRAFDHGAGRDGTTHDRCRHGAPHDRYASDRDASDRCTSHDDRDRSSYDDTPAGCRSPRCDERGSRERHGQWQQRERLGDAGRFLVPARRQPQSPTRRGRPEHIRCGLFLFASSRKASQKWSACSGVTAPRARRHYASVSGDVLASWL